VKYNLFKVGDVVQLANMYDRSEMCFEGLIAIIVKISEDAEFVKTVVNRDIIEELERKFGYEKTRELKKPVLVRILSPMDDKAYEEFISDTSDWHEEELSVSEGYLIEERLAGFFPYQLAHVKGKIKLNTTAIQMFLR